MITLSPLNALAIGQYTQTLNNRFFDRYGKITAIQKVKSFLLARYEDLCRFIMQVNNGTVTLNFDDFDTITRACARETRYIYGINSINLDTGSRICSFSLQDKFSINIKAFLESIKKDMEDLKGYKKRENEDSAHYKKGNYFLSDLASFSRQASLTHPEKDSLFFLACWLIASSKSSSKRIVWRVLLVRSYNFLDFCSCIGSNHYDIFLNDGANHFKVKYLKKQCPNVLRAQLRHLTTNIKDANAMANSNDTLHPKNGQQDLFNLYAVLSQYHANFTQSNLLQAKSHLDELQQSIISGVGVLGNLMYWAAESDNYEAEQLKNDMRDISYLLIHLRDIAIFVSNEINQINVKSGKGAV